MLDLYVWGSAFGLPSIDAECLAAVAYLHHAAPRSAWRLNPSNDPSISPSHHLPALHHAGVWTSGFHPIIRYLASHRLCDDLDAGLSDGQRADCVAYGAFLALRAAALLDLSLYVSAANWGATTRPAYSALLSFPLTWTVPPLIRAEAIRRTENLGLAELDTDFDPSRRLHLSAGQDALPETFRKHLPARRKKSVRGEMTPEQAVAIRLCALTDDCLSKLKAVLADAATEQDSPRCFGGRSISSLDCLAYAYLALMHIPDVPRPFLRDWIDAETPLLSRFVQSVSLDGLCSAQPDSVGLLHSSNRLLTSILRQAPFLGEWYANEIRRRSEAGITGLDGRAAFQTFGVLFTGVLAAYGLWTRRTLPLFGAGFQVWRAQRLTSKLNPLGEAGILLGSALDAYPLQPPPMMGFRVGNMDKTSHGRLVDMDSESL